MTAAEDIVTEIIALLTSPPLVSAPAAKIFRDPMEAREAAELPCISVEAGSEDAPQRVVIGLKRRTLEVTITVYAKGTNPYLQADPMLIESHNRLFGAARVNGLLLNGLAEDINEGTTRRDRAGLAEDLAAITKTYLIDYRTSETSLERLT